MAFFFFTRARNTEDTVTDTRGTSTTSTRVGVGERPPENTAGHRAVVMETAKTEDRYQNKSRLAVDTSRWWGQHVRYTEIDVHSVTTCRHSDVWKGKRLRFLFSLVVGCIVRTSFAQAMLRLTKLPTHSSRDWFAVRIVKRESVLPKEFKKSIGWWTLVWSSFTYQYVITCKPCCNVTIMLQRNALWSK